MLVDLGVADQSEVSQQLVTDPDEPLPASLEREREKAIEARQKQRKEKQHREEQEKIRKAFTNGEGHGRAKHANRTTKGRGRTAGDAKSTGDKLRQAPQLPRATRYTQVIRCCGGTQEAMSEQPAGEAFMREFDPRRGFSHASDTLPGDPEFRQSA